MAKWCTAIFAKDEAETLASCVDRALEDGGGNELEVVVVINGSTDDTASIVQSRLGK